MKKLPAIEHSWDLQPQDAIKIQKRLARRVIRKSEIGHIASIAGVDAGYRNGWARAAVVKLDFPALEPLEQVLVAEPVRFPYVPGLLTFREGPAVIAALLKLSTPPDLIIFDGQGIAHPRRLGLASHVGVLLDIPSIGCAKTKLVGKYEEPGTERGSFSFLTDQGEIIGAVVRTRTAVKPVFVSMGHRVDLKDSIQLVLDCCRGYRLPEATRWADKLSRADG
ncbi:MAG: deoxyribonuclease V [Desulfobacterales bacterium]|nr:MAG: deoxyribonuclease V [Desulfobacterales bacterium]